MEKTLQRLLSFALAVLMVFSCVPTSALATELASDDIIVASDDAAIDNDLPEETDPPVETTEAPAETDPPVETTEAPVEETVDEAAVQALIALIEALPTAEEVSQMDIDALEALTEDFMAIENAFGALNAPSKAAVASAWADYVVVKTAWETAYEATQEEPVDDLAGEGLDENELEMAGVEEPVAAVSFFGDGLDPNVPPVMFEDLVEAFAYANANAPAYGTGMAQIQLIDDVNLEAGETLYVSNGVQMTVKMMGHDIVGSPANAAAFALIENKGDLTIDSVGNPDPARITLTSSLPASTAYAVNTIHNMGKLYINGNVAVSNSGSGNQIGYAIDNNAIHGDVELGLAYAVQVTAAGSVYFDAIRQICSENHTNNVMIGMPGVSAHPLVSSLWVQNPSDGTAGRNTKAVNGSFTVYNGQVHAIYVEPGVSNSFAINGGTIGSISYVDNGTNGTSLTAVPTGFLMPGATYTTEPAAEMIAKDYMWQNGQIVVKPTEPDPSEPSTPTEPPVVDVPDATVEVEVPEGTTTTVDTEALITEVKEETAKLNEEVVLPEEVSTLRITFCQVAVSETAPTRLTFKVEPVDSSNKKVSAPTSAITFCLPIPDSVVNEFVNVYHETTLMGMFPIKGTDGARYVEVTSASFSNFIVEPADAAVKIGETGYATLDAALAAAKTMTGNVTVEVYGKVEYSASTANLTGAYDAISFVGKTDDAEICITRNDGGGYIAASKPVSFADLILSKPEGAFAGDAGFMNLYFTVYGADVTYTDCVFPNGACAQKNSATYTDCEFANEASGLYSLWIYADTNVTVEGCKFTGVRGVKMFSDGAFMTADLVMKNTEFTASVTQKPAIVLTHGESVTLDGNTYPTKGVFELDMDGTPDGTKIVADTEEIAKITCVNDNGACGVLVDGKIYTTVAQAAEVATSGSTVTLLHNSAETVELPEGVTLDKNGFTAAGVTVPASGLKGSGTAEDPFLIENLDDLIWFRDSVNTYTSDGSNQYKGQYVKLTADIDLDGINWTPIGTNSVGDHMAFLGTFDGGGHTISNLSIYAADDYLGFFARTGSFNETQSATVKNITFHNVDVASSITNSHGGSYVGGVIANSGGNTTVSNVKLTGDIYVEGYGYVGGIVGHGYPKIDNCHVTANDGSYVKCHYWCGGGIIGYAGEGGTRITNSSVSGLDIWSAYGAGGAVAGLLNAGNTLTNVSASNVEISSASDNIMGYIAGNGEESTLTNVTASNVTATANGKDITSTDAVAKVDGAVYFSLADAIAAANGGTVVILRDVTENIPAIENVTLTTNVEGGITVTNTFAADYADFNDVTVGSGVTLNLNNTFVSGSENVIEGTLNVTGVYYNAYNATTIVRNGGKVTTTGMTVNRYHNDSDAGIYIYGDGNDETIEWSSGDTIGTYSGTFYAEDAVVKCNQMWLDFYKADNNQEPDTYAPLNAKFVNSTVNVTKEFKLYKDASLTLEGTEINVGTQFQIRANATPTVNMDADSVIKASSVLTQEGATLTAKLNDDGTVSFVTFVAEVDGVKYETLEEALAAVKADSTLTLLADVTISSKITVNSDLTIDGNGHTLTYTGADRAIDVPKEHVTDLTVNNLTLEFTGGYSQRGINYNSTGTLTLDNVTVVGTNVTYAVNLPGAADGAEVNITNSNITGLIALNIWGSNAVVNVTDTDLTSVDNTDAENYTALKLNNDGTTSAEGTVVTVTGGKITALDQKGELSTAASNATVTGKIIISDSTKVTGNITEVVAAVRYDGYDEFYSFTTLQDAFDKAAENANTTVVLLKDIQLDETVSVPNGNTVVFDLNGHTIAGTDNTTKSFGLINNNGDLTIMDSVGSGKITLTATNDTGYSRYSSVISNGVGGNLTLVSGTIDHLGGHTMAYGIDNLTNGAGTSAVVTIKGGTVDSSYVGIRQFMNGVEAQNILTINGGTVTGDNCALFVQSPSTKANTGTLTVDANATLGNRVYLGLEDGTTVWAADIAISEKALGTNKIVDDGLPAGYMIENTNGIWGVNHYVASITSGRQTFYYETLEAAIADAKPGETVSLITDVELTETLVIPAEKQITLDLNGHVISQEKACTEHYAMIENKGDLTIKDSVGNGKISFTDTGAGDPEFGWGAYTIVTSGNLTVESGTIENLSKQNTPGNVVHMYCAIQQSSGNVTINGGTISTPYYRSIRVNSGSLTVNNGTLDGQVWVQPNADGTSLTINGGSFAPKNGDSSSVFVTNDSKSVTLSITDGIFSGKIGASVPANLAGSITGGNFTKPAADNTNEALLKEGYELTDEDGDGIYNLTKVIVYVAEIKDAEGNSVKYETLEAAVDAAADGGVIELLAKPALRDYAIVGKNLTIVRNGFTATVSALTGYTVLVDETAYVVTSDFGTSEDEGALVAYIDVNNDAVRDETEELMSLNAALKAATSGQTVRLTAALVDKDAEGTVIIPGGVILDIGEFNLEADYIIGLKGSMITNAASGTAGARLLVGKDNLALSADPFYRPANDRHVLPVWDANNGNYVFANFKINDSGNNRGITYTEDGGLVFQFKHASNGTINELFRDEKGSEDNAVTFEVVVSWTTDNGRAYQHFVYNADQVGKVSGKIAGQSFDFKFTMSNYKAYEDLTIYAVITTDSGAQVTSTYFDIT